MVRGVVSPATCGTCGKPRQVPLTSQPEDAKSRRARRARAEGRACERVARPRDGEDSAYHRRYTRKRNTCRVTCAATPVVATPRGSPKRDRGWWRRGNKGSNQNSLGPTVASIAQLAEHALRKRTVVGSIPTGGFIRSPFSEVETPRTARGDHKGCRLDANVRSPVLFEAAAPRWQPIESFRCGPVG